MKTSISFYTPLSSVTYETGEIGIGSSGINNTWSVADQLHNLTAERIHTHASAFFKSFILGTQTVLDSPQLSRERIVMKTFAHPNIRNGNGTVWARLQHKNKWYLLSLCYELRRIKFRYYTLQNFIANRRKNFLIIIQTQLTVHAW